MKNNELIAFRRTQFLVEGHHKLLDLIRPSFEKLISALIALPDSASESTLLTLFEKCFQAINKHENDIETVERETILDAIYTIGTIVGLDQSTEYAEQWRGDW